LKSVSEQCGCEKVRTLINADNKKKPADICVYLRPNLQSVSEQCGCEKIRTLINADNKKKSADICVLFSGILCLPQRHTENAAKRIHKNLWPIYAIKKSLPEKYKV